MIAINQQNKTIILKRISKNNELHTVNPPSYAQQSILLKSLEYIRDISNIHLVSLPTITNVIFEFNHSFSLLTTSTSWSKKLLIELKLIYTTVNYFSQFNYLVKNNLSHSYVVFISPLKVHKKKYSNLTSKIVTFSLNFRFQLFSHYFRFKSLVMSTDDIGSQEENRILESDNEDNDLNTTIIARTPLLRTISLESSLNRISSNLSRLEVETSSHKRSRALDSPEESNPTNSANSNPGKRLKIVQKMLPLTSEIVKNDFHIVDIVSDDAAVEFLTTGQGTSIYTAVLKEIMKTQNISQINFEDSFNDRGKYRYICSNAATRDWLVNIIPTITPWADAKIKPVNQGPPPTLIKYIINVTLPSLDPGDVFTLMAAQNAKLDTTNWKCTYRSKADHGKQTWIVGVDEKSIEALKEIDFKPYVGTSRMKLIPKK